jgi:hypothetical protein
VTAVVAGGIVWAMVAVGLVGWLVVTQVAGRRRLPTVASVGRWFLQCWLGRFLLIAAWAGAGWHLFCQRP